MHYLLNHARHHNEKIQANKRRPDIILHNSIRKVMRLFQWGIFY